MGKSWILMVVLVAGCAGTHGNATPSGEKDEGNEVKVKFSELPEPVQKTLMEQADGAKIDSVDRQTKKDGTTVYEADAMINGKNYEILVAPDGKLIDKKLDNE